MGARKRETGVALVALAALVWGLAAAGPLKLYPPRLFPVGQEAVGIVVADLDRDGTLDIATANNEAAYGSVLFGNGDGTFVPEVRLPRQVHTAGGVVTVDLNEDGADELVIVDNAISIWENKGDRTFGDELRYGFGFYRSIVAADFNRDGHADLAAGRTAGVIVLYMGNGDGTFAPESYIAGADADCALVSGDFDGDGRIDLFGTGCGGQGTLYLGLGDGAFGQQIKFPFGDWGVLAEDFNGDGLSDLANVSDGKVSIRLAVGGGSFSPAVQYPALAGALSLGLGDLDADGDQDLVASAWAIEGSREVAVLLSNGDGTFAAAVRYETPLLGGPVGTGDFDRDGRIDVAVASHWGTPGSKVFATNVDFVFILPGDGRGGLIGQGVPRFKAGDGPRAIVGGDFNGDGLTDVATANRLSNDVSVAKGAGDGTFGAMVRFPVGLSPVSLVAGRLDSGVTQDLAVADQGSSEISTLLGRGDGTFATGPTLPLGKAPVCVVTADFNGDGIQDLATANPDTDDVSITLGVGDGNFGTPSHLPVGDRPVWLVVANLDGQSGPDLAVVNQGAVSILLGNGDGTFGSETRFPTGTTALTAIAAADLNGDGHSDLAVSAADVPSLVILYGDGQGGLSAPLPLGIEASGKEVAIADVDGDGHQDLVVTHYEAMVSVLLGTDGGFAEARGFLADDRGSVAIADLDRDGNLDLAVSGTDWDRVSILLNHLPPHLRFESDKDTLTWRMRLGVDSYNIYRGDLADLVDLDGDGLVEGGYGVCMTAFDPDPTDNVFVDAEVPVQGKGFFYLMALVDAQGEHGLGETSTGLPRFPAVPCTQAAQRRAVVSTESPGVAASERTQPGAFSDVGDRERRLQAKPAKGRGGRR